MKWFERKRKEIIDNIVDDAAISIKNKTNDILRNNKKQVKSAISLVLFGIALFELISTGTNDISKSLSSCTKIPNNFTLYIESVNVTINNH